MTCKSIITIGRQYGSGGHEIGQKLAKELGIKCYDKELLDRAAKESGICQELFEHHDERPTNSFLYSLVMDTYSMSGYTSAPFVPEICQNRINCCSVSPIVDNLFYICALKPKNNNQN
mgnify:FL=1